MNERTSYQIVKQVPTKRPGNLSTYISVHLTVVAIVPSSYIVGVFPYVTVFPNDGLRGTQTEIDKPEANKSEVNKRNPKMPFRWLGDLFHMQTRSPTKPEAIPDPIS